MSIIDRLEHFAWRTIAKRPADFVIHRGKEQQPYLYRWWVIPRNPIFNIYLHLFRTSDPDDVLHDHPWDNLTICVNGAYQEHMSDGRTRTVRRGSLALRRATTGHRIELRSTIALTLFITGPKRREWGFWCPKGWVHWTDYVESKSNSDKIGRGCA